MLNSRMNLVESATTYHTNDYNVNKKNRKSLMYKLQPNHNHHFQKIQQRKSHSNEKKMQFKINNINYLV
jgi:hypothetical protein